LRRGCGATLTTLSDTIGIPVTTLSRLESGHRKPGLELLLPLARAYQVLLDTHLPHWFGNADGRPVEFLSILGPQGERFHLSRARYRPG
jgi:transcriptional regulator with XRE-family HTH domain